MSLLRLNKYLARAGLGSRRKVEDLVRAGVVTINGETVKELGVQVNVEKDHVKVHGKRVSPPKASPIYVLMNKPKNVMVTRDDPNGRPTVFDYLKNIPKTIFYVGRLDFDTEGLLLLTTDGELAQRMTHPKYSVPRTYQVKVKGVPDEKALGKLRAGIMIAGEKSKATQVEISRVGDENAWLKMILTEGKNRQIKEFCHRIGHPLSKLIRVAYGPIKLGRMAPGAWRFLREEEVSELRDYLKELERRVTRKSTKSERSASPMIRD